jgi:hypothetical protein
MMTSANSTPLEVAAVVVMITMTMMIFDEYANP